MDCCPHYGDHIARAEADVSSRKAELEAACDRARRSRSRTDWLADRPDLATAHRLIEDISGRQALLEHATHALQQAFDQRIRARTAACPFKAPLDLDEQIALHRRLTEALVNPAAGRILLSLLNDSRLAPSLKKGLADFANRADRARRLADRLAYPRTKFWQKTYEEAIADTRWQDSIKSDVRARLRDLEHRRASLEKDHVRKLGDEVQAELGALKAEVDRAATAVSEAENALQWQKDIDRIVADRTEAFVAEQTCTQRQALEVAAKALHETRRQCVEHFRSHLRNDFLNARIDAFAPPGDYDLRQRLSEGKTRFVRDWASAHLPFTPDPEQYAAIGSVHEHVLVTARAGSGKTRAVTTRAAFLIKHCRVSPDELLLLAFNRKAAEEMRGRLQEIGCEVPHAMTFHALAYAIVHPEQALIYDSPDDSQPQLSRAFQQVLNELLGDSRFEADVRSLMLDHFRADWDKLTRAGLTLSAEVGLQFRRALPSETLRGEYVKSFGEKAIANFLFEHDRPYQYERNYWWNGRNYRPDFTIPLGQQGVIIEYFGLAGDPDYDEEAADKRAYWRNKKGWRFIELAPGDVAQGLEHLYELLRQRLDECGVQCCRLSEDEVWKRLRDRVITRFAQMARTFVGRCRTAGLDPAELDAQIAKHQVISEIEATFLRLAVEVFARYVARLSAVGEEDFNGLMKRAADDVEGGKTVFCRKSGRGDLSKIRFIMVDEFQDFTPLFFRLLQAARRHNPTIQVFCVGDDWQAINAFAGATTRYFEQFDQHFAPAVRLPIATNYRSAPCLVEVGNCLMSGRGIPARPGLSHEGRILIADLSRFEPTAAEREKHPGVVITPVVQRMLGKALKDGGNVAILARRNVIPYYLGKDMGRATLDMCRRVWTDGLTDEEKDRVSIMTAHKYKGLQAQTVVILDALPRCYPLIHPDWVFMRVLGDDVPKLIDDELRLFYVACTRAENALILVTEGKEESPFLDRIRDLCDHLDWSEFPPLLGSGSRWVVKVGSRPGRGSKPTFDVRNDLKAHGFRFFGKQPWPHWACTYPCSDDDLQSLLRTLQSHVWARNGVGLEVRICDQGDSTLGVYWVDEGRWTARA